MACFEFNLDRNFKPRSIDSLSDAMTLSDMRPTHESNLICSLNLVKFASIFKLGGANLNIVSSVGMLVLRLLE